MNIGTHIPKSKSFYLSLKKFFDIEKNKDRPVQFFTGSPKFWKRPKITKEEVERTKKYIIKNNLWVFVHSIYLINLSQPEEKFNEKAFGCLKWEMQAGLLCGFKGVVVHTGKSLKMPINDALDNMFNNICNILKHTSPTCPLLLETSSGQGSETLWNYEDFSKFYKRFTETQQERIKICIDTCHIFAAGHDPFKFIKDWDKEFPESLILVHFNDSKEKCGEKKDRHACPGCGHIGSKKLRLVEYWCKNKNIPMVLE